MEGGIIFIFIIFIVIAIVAAIYGHKKEKERQAAIAAFASAKGLMFHPDKVRGFDQEYPEFDCLKQGSHRYAYNILAGRWKEFEVKIFDYHYETKSTDSKGNTKTQHHYFSAAFLAPSFPLLPLKIRKEGFFDRMSSAFGFNDIDFESAEFSRRFHVSSPDKKWAYDAIQPRTMELLLANPDYALQSDHQRLCVWKSGRLKVEEIELYLDHGMRFLDGIPDFRKTTPA